VKQTKTGGISFTTREAAILRFVLTPNVPVKAPVAAAPAPVTAGGRARAKAKAAPTTTTTPKAKWVKRECAYKSAECAGKTWLPNGTGSAAHTSCEPGRQTLADLYSGKTTRDDLLAAIKLV
jgi:hypothetical protein